MKNWKLIFNTNNYHYILIKESIKEKYLTFFYKHEDEIKKVDDFFFLIPSKKDIELNNIQKNAVQYAMDFKKFLTDPTKKTIFIEEDVLKSFVNEDKRSNFFRLISQQNKNIVLFCYGDLDKFAKNANYSYIEFTEDQMEENYNILNQFKEIKNTFSNINNLLKTNT